MPKNLKILTSPNPFLRKISKEVDLKKAKRKELEELGLDMTQTMLESDGVGLAAPQIGKNLRIITVNTKEGVLFMLNPKITKKSLLKIWGEEGCLSVPNIFGQVKRHKKLTCVYFNIEGKEIKLSAEGLFARIIQHELDHLDGKLFIDIAKDLKEQTSKPPRKLE